MKPFPVPVRAAGPGSQSEDEEPLDYLPMPREMNTFSMPRIPETASDADMSAARVVLERFTHDMTPLAPNAARVDLAGLPEGLLRVLNETLGEGEVGIRIVSPAEIRIQETVFAGVWRDRHFNARGEVVHDWLSACPIPPIAIAIAQQAGSPDLTAAPPTDDTMNAPSVLHEIGEAMRAHLPGAAAHVINLTLLPLSPGDHRAIDEALAPGPVVMLSRGFGNCRISSTCARNVWRVQYFNTMNTLILDTLEIIDTPEVAMAANDDLADSRERLLELIEWMAQSVPDQA